jgi:asparagine synthase (glutamine-hydrolysing)
VIRTLAGIYDADPASERDARRDMVARALDATTGRVLDAGPLVAGATAAAPAQPGPSREPVCLLDGRLYDLDRLARDLGAPPTAEPEDLLGRAYARWDEAMLDRLRGQFVAVIWDRERHRGLVARDQLGARPLFWHAASGRLRFASEIGPLLRLIPRRPGPDRTAVVQWLAGWRVEEDRTLHEGIRRLGAGHYLRLAGDGWTERRYWAPRYRGAPPRPRAEIVDQVRSGIERSIRRRVSGNAVHAVMLSGGLDSSSVAAVAAREVDVGTGSLLGYSAVFPDHPSADESAIIDRFTESIGLPGVQMAARGGSALAGALDFLRRWEVPPKPPLHYVWDTLLERAAAEGVSVVIDGEGGDELFGAARYLLADRLRQARVVSAMRLARRFPGYPGQLPWRLAARMTSRVGGRGALPHQAHAAARRLRDPRRHVPGWFTDESARLYRDATDPWNWKLTPGPRWWSHLATRVTSDREAFGVHDYLRRMAAAPGLEIRHPLMDLDLIELMLSLPPEASIEPGYTRPLFRESMSGLVPDEVRLRTDKTFFDPVWQEAVTERDLGPIRQLFAAGDAEVNDYVIPDVIRAQLLGGPDAHPRGSRDWAMDQWRLAMVECWLRTQSDPGFAERLLDTWAMDRPRCSFSTPVHT